MKTLMLMAVVVASGCAVTSHGTQAARLGTVRSTADLVAALAEPGTVTLETVASADWVVDRSGLINLGNPIAKQAGLVDGDEKIEVVGHFGETCPRTDRFVSLSSLRIVTAKSSADSRTSKFA